MGHIRIRVIQKKREGQKEGRLSDRRSSGTGYETVIINYEGYVGLRLGNVLGEKEKRDPMNSKN